MMDFCRQKAEMQDKTYIYIDVHACDLRVQCLGADSVPVFD